MNLHARIAEDTAEYMRTEAPTIRTYSYIATGLTGLFRWEETHMAGITGITFTYNSWKQHKLN